jgi:CRISPR-associated protein Csb2
MQIVLRQEFPLGRFHATPWGVNPFDDPYGEWPPSPWRLIRSVTARWYQWAREAETEPAIAELERLQATLCKSTYSFHLPADARKGAPLRQYHPTEFGMDPPKWRHVARFRRAAGGEATEDKKKNIEVKSKIKSLEGVQLTEEKRDGHLDWDVTAKDKGAEEIKKQVEQILGAPTDPWQRVADAGSLGYGTSLAQDNYWAVAPEAPVWWFIECGAWTEELAALLDQCLARMTYFGRAETLTRIRRAGDSDGPPESNCRLIEQRTSGSVPVLTSLHSATRDDIERVTDHPESSKGNVPPGTRVLYAVRPPRAASREARHAPARRADCHLLQFALGWNVKPEPRAIVRLTSRFRGAVLCELLRLKTGDPSWSRADRSVREAIADMAGKDADNQPLEGHRRHTEFFAWCDDRRPTRLLVWRGARAFDEDEQEAVLLAAARDVSWAAAGSDADQWRVRLIPLDRHVPAPPGVDGQAAVTWESVTAYVPPRHHLRGGKEREGESIANQIRRELQHRGFTNVDGVSVEVLGERMWVAVHVPRKDAGNRAFTGDRLGRAIRLTFPTPVVGPIRLGHSSSFGLGHFRPVF